MRGRSAVTALAAVFALAVSLSTTSGEEVAPAIDVSGRRGVDGKNGADGWGSGADGQDGGPSTPGEHAGSLDLTVASDPAGGFVVRGSSTPAFAHAASPDLSVTAVERVQRLGQVVPLLARGGDGGHGGDGGDGATGATGSSGSDATCYSSGGSGGMGGRGGDGGDATSGSDGGRGGDVTVRVAGRDTHLLLLVEPDDRGGRGGAAGRNGRGGAGGAGGAGGRSHSSHGTGNNRCSGKPGGSRGPSGSPGSSGWATVHAGSDGAAGRITYVVDGVEHPDRYRLELSSFEIVSANDDGVFEPGEEVTVRGIVAHNRGGVATPPPALHETRVYLPLTRNVSAPTKPILLPVSLAHGETAALPDTLRFTIPDVDVDQAVAPNVRYADEGRVDPRAHVADARRDHPEFVDPRPFPVTFPLVLRPVQFGSAMGAGETRRIVLEVENVSTRPYGREVEAWQAAHGQPFDPALRRGIHVTFGFEGRTLRPDDLALIDPAGEAVDLARGGFTWEIDALGPGEVARCEVSLGLRPEAEAYAGGDLAIDLHLGRLGRPEHDRRVIERRRLPVRVAARWQRPSRPSLLLVTNVGVEQEVVRAWRALAGGLGYGLAIWDVSYYGFLPLGARREGRADALLMDDVAGHLAIVVGNRFPSPIVDDAGAPLPWEPASFLAPDEVVRAARAGLHTLVVGGGLTLYARPTAREQVRELDDWRSATRWRGEAFDVAAVSSLGAQVAAVTTPSLVDLVVPTGAPARVVEHASADDLLAALEDDAPEVHAPDVVHRVPLREDWFYGKPKRYRVETVAARLLDELAARWPERRYVAVTRDDPALEDGALWNGIRHGFADVRRVPTAGLDVLEVPAERLGRADHVHDPQALEAVLRALPFERKLELLAGYLDGRLPAPVEGPRVVTVEALGPALAHAIVADLAFEVDAWRTHVWSGLTASGHYRERMTRHAALARLALTRPLAPDPADPRAACALRVAAASELMAGAIWGPEDVLVPLAARRYFVAAAIAGTLGDGLADEFLRAVFGPDAELDAVRRTAEDELRRRQGGPNPWDLWQHRTGSWPAAYSTIHGVTSRDAVGSLAELAMQRAIDAARAARRDAFLEGLDRLRIRTELSEGLAPGVGAGR